MTEAKIVRLTATSTKTVPPLIIKQDLAPVDDEDPVIFPPTYPMTAYKGRVHTIRDGITASRSSFRLTRRRTRTKRKEPEAWVQHRPLS